MSRSDWLDLPACPFCGGKKLLAHVWDGGKKCAVVCHQCGAWGPEADSMFAGLTKWIEGLKNDKKQLQGR